MKQVLEDVRDAYVFGKTQLSAMLRLLPRALPPRGSATHDRACCLPRPSGTLARNGELHGCWDRLVRSRISHQSASREELSRRTNHDITFEAVEPTPPTFFFLEQSVKAFWSLVSGLAAFNASTTSFPWGLRFNGTRSTPTGTRQVSSLTLLYVSEPAGAYRAGHLFVSCDKDAQHTRIRPRQ